MIDWNKLFGLLFLILFGAFIFDKYDDQKLLRGFYEDVADQIKPLLGLMTRQEVAAEHQRLKDLTAAREEAELRLASKLEQTRLAQERQHEQELKAQEEQERLAQEEQERAAKYAAALDRAYALGRGELSQRPTQPSDARQVPTRSEMHSLDTKSEMLTFSDRTEGGRIILPSAVVEKVTPTHVVVVSKQTGDKLKVPLARAAKNVQLRIIAGKEIDEALAKLQAGGAPAAQLDSWQNSVSWTRADQAAEQRAARGVPTQAQMNEMRLRNIEKAIHRAEQIDFMTRSIQGWSQNAIDFSSSKASRAQTVQEQRKWQGMEDAAVRKRDANIRLVPRNVDQRFD
jgi:hypothetical protein